MPGLKFLKCPNCGAPINRKIPLGTTYICPYCQGAIEAPAAPTPRPQAVHTSGIDDNSVYYDDSGKRIVIYVIVAGLLVVSVGGVIFSMAEQPLPSPPPPSIQEPVHAEAPPLPEPAPEPVPSVSDARGEKAVTDGISTLEGKGCEKILLPATTVTGPQRVETQFIAKKGCVHILAATGDDGAPLKLSLKTPSKKVVETPPASREIHFVYCPKRSGKHPLKIEAENWDMYTVAAIECPSSVKMYADGDIPSSECGSPIIDNGCPSYPPVLADNVTSFYDENPGIAHGKLEVVTYPVGSGTDHMTIYTPPGYDQCPNAAYPVLYLNHGRGDDHTNWSCTDFERSDCGGAARIADNLIASGDALPMIIVMPRLDQDCWGFSSRRPVSGPNQQCAPKYIGSIIPYVERHYRVRKDRDSRALAGLSMGGYTTLSVGIPHIDLFSYHFVFSAGYDTSGAAQLLALLDLDTVNAMLNAPYYLAVGESDTVVRIGERAKQTAAVFDASGMRFHFELTSGGHEWMNWRRYLHQTLQVVFKNRSGCDS